MIGTNKYAHLQSMSLTYDGGLSGVVKIACRKASETEVESFNAWSGASGGTASSMSLQFGTEYVLKIEGTWRHSSGDTLVRDYDMNSSNVHAPHGEIDTGNGAGFTHIEPEDAPWSVWSSNPDHIYRVHVIGQGVPVKFRVGDSFYPDNIGTFVITILEVG